MASTFRVDFRAGLASVLTTYQAANPTLLNKVYSYPPGEYNTPCAFIEKTINERQEMLNGVWQRILTGTVVIVCKLISNEQATNEQDVLIDGLVDAYSTNFHAASGSSEIEPVSVTDTEITAGEGVRYAAAIITVQGTKQEGRL